MSEDNGVVERTVRALAECDRYIGDETVIWALDKGDAFTAADLRALLALARQSTDLDQWQGIETLDVSKLSDGEEMLVFNDRGMFVGAWEPDWSPKHGFHGGWWMVSDGKYPERALRGDTPTHWRPLPAPPQPQREDS
jgi:hypothetical protein